MKLVRNTPETLIFQHRRMVRPWFVGFFALLFLVMAYFAYEDAPGITYGLVLIAALLIFGLVVFDLQQSHVVFSRRAGTVTIRHGILGRGKPQVIKLGAIREAFVSIAGTNAQVTGTMMDGGQKCPTLAMRHGKSVPLSPIANFNKSHDVAVQVINDWLGRKKKSDATATMD